MATNETDLVKRVRECFPETGVAPRAKDENTLKLLLIGSPQQNLFGVLHETFGNLDDLDCPMTNGYCGTILYSDSKTAFLTGEGGVIPTSPSALADTLKRYNKANGRQQFTLTLNLPILEGWEFRVLADDGDYEGVNWEAELSAADYILFTMSSTSLLSMSERKLLRSWLLPYASKALGIILTKDNLILGADRKDIQETLDAMLHNAVPIYRFPEKDASRLRDQLGLLKGCGGMLRELRDARVNRLVLNAAKTATEMQIQVLTDNGEELQKTIQTIKDSAEKLPGRSNAALRQIRTQHLEPLRIELTRAVMEYQKDLDNRLSRDIEESIDASELSDVLASYLADAWKSKSALLLEQLQARAVAMQNDLQLYIEKDFMNYIESSLGEKRADYVYALTDQYFQLEGVAFQTGDNVFQYNAPFDSRKLQFYGAIGAGIALVLASHPIIGIAVAAFGSKAIKEQAQASYSQKNKQGLIASCAVANHEYSDEMLLWLNTVLDTVRQSIYEAVEDCYQKMTDAVVQALSSRMQDKNNYAQRLEELVALREEIVQALEG